SVWEAARPWRISGRRRRIPRPGAVFRPRDWARGDTRRRMVSPLDDGLSGLGAGAPAYFSGSPVLGAADFSSDLAPAGFSAGASTGFVPSDFSAGLISAGLAAVGGGVCVFDAAGFASGFGLSPGGADLGPSASLRR